MIGKKDNLKGRIEQEAGQLTVNDKLRQKGRTDQALGHAKKTAQAPVHFLKTDPAFGHVKQISKKIMAKGSKRMHS